MLKLRLISQDSVGSSSFGFGHVFSFCKLKLTSKLTGEKC